MREAGPDGRDARLCDVRRRVEVGLTRAEADHILPLGLEPCGAGRHHEGRGGLYALHAP